MTSPGVFRSWGIVGAQGAHQYRQLQKKHEAILGGYEPVVMRTTIREAPCDLDSRFVSR